MALSRPRPNVSPSLLEDEAQRLDRTGSLLVRWRGWLRDEHVLAPADSVLRRAVGAARQKARALLTQRMAERLSAPMRDRLNALVAVGDDDPHSPLHRIKTGARVHKRYHAPETPCARVWAKSETELQAVIYPAKEAGMGADMMFTPGEPVAVGAKRPASPTVRQKAAESALSPCRGAVPGAWGRAASSGVAASLFAFYLGVARLHISLPIYFRNIAKVSGRVKADSDRLPSFPKEFAKNESGRYRTAPKSESELSVPPPLTTSPWRFSGS